MVPSTTEVTAVCITAIRKRCGSRYTTVIGKTITPEPVGTTGAINSSWMCSKQPRQIEVYTEKPARIDEQAFLFAVRVQSFFGAVVVTGSPRSIRDLNF